MQRFKKIDFLLLLLPLLYFFYAVYTYIVNAYKVRLCDLTYSIHNFILFEFFAIIIILLKRYSLMRYIGRYWYIITLYLVIVVSRAWLLIQQDIALDLVYLSHIMFAGYLEIVPLLILLMFTDKSRFAKYTFIFFTNLIIFSNIAFYIYYLNTGEVVEYIIFENLNMESVKGTIHAVSWLTLSGVFVLFIVFNYFLAKSLRNAKISWKAVISTGIFLWVGSTILHMGDEKIVGKICTRYGTIRPTQTQILGKIDSNSAWSIAQAYRQYLHKDSGDSDRLSNAKRYTYSPQEEELANRMFGDAKTCHIVTQKKQYDRIIFLVFESLSIDFLHYYNPKIPKEVTPNFDRLLRNYFHFNDMYTSNMPTDYGLTALLKSRLDKDRIHESLFSVLKKQGYLTVFLRGSSKFYGDHMVYYPRAFQYDVGIFQEELVKEYGRKYSGWGFNNHLLYDKALKLMEENKDKKLFLTVKTIDFHLPGPKCDLSGEELPDFMRQKNDLMKGLYWIDRQLGWLMDRMEKSKLLDDKTLVVITADHNPHLGVDFRSVALLPDNFRRLARIPMIFVTKNHDFKKYESFENTICSQIDMAPTILSVNGISVPEDFRGRVVFEDCNRSFAVGKYKDNAYYVNEKQDLQTELDNCDKKKNLSERVLCKYVYDVLRNGEK